ncbi:hypothetical protein N2152v2_004955 [Parachlorella kessleri]
MATAAVAHRDVHTLEKAWSVVQRSKAETAADVCEIEPAEPEPAPVPHLNLQHLQRCLDGPPSPPQVPRCTPRNMGGASSSEEMVNGLQRALVAEQNRAASFKQQLGLFKRQHQMELAAVRDELGEAERQLQSKLALMGRSLAASDEEIASLRRALALEQGRSASHRQALEAAKKEHHIITSNMREQLWEAGRAEKDVDALRRSLMAGREEVSNAKILLTAAQGRAAQLERMLEAAGTDRSPPDQMSALRAAAAAELEAALQAAERRRQSEVSAVAREAAGAARELATAQKHNAVMQEKLRAKEAEASRLSVALTAAERMAANAKEEVKWVKEALQEKEAEVTKLQRAAGGNKSRALLGIPSALSKPLPLNTPAQALEPYDSGSPTQEPASAARQLAAASKLAAAELAAALKATERRRQEEVATLIGQLAGAQRQLDSLQGMLGDKQAELAKAQAAAYTARKQAAEAIESLQQQLVQTVSGWLHSGPSDIPGELASSVQALLGQLQESCQLEMQNQQRPAAAAAVLPAVLITVGAGRPPTTPAPTSGRKAGPEGSPRRSPRRLHSPRRLPSQHPAHLQSHRVAADGTQY